MQIKQYGAFCNTTVLCHAMPCHAVLCCAVPPYVWVDSKKLLCLIFKFPLKNLLLKHGLLKKSKCGLDTSFDKN